MLPVATDKRALKLTSLAFASPVHSAFKMLSILLIVVSFLVATSFQVANLKQNNAYMSRLQMSTTSASVAILPSLETDKLVIRLAGVDELPQCAGFLSNNMYAAGVPKGCPFAGSL